MKKRDRNILTLLIIADIILMICTGSYIGFAIGSFFGIMFGPLGTLIGGFIGIIIQSLI